MKRITLMSLVATLALVTNAAAAPAYNSKANTDKVPAPDAGFAVLTGNGFDAERVNSKVQTVAPADADAPVVNIDPATASSKGPVATN